MSINHVQRWAGAVAENDQWTLHYVRAWLTLLLIIQSWNSFNETDQDIGKGVSRTLAEKLFVLFCHLQFGIGNAYFRRYTYRGPVTDSDLVVHEDGAEIRNITSHLAKLSQITGSAYIGWQQDEAKHEWFLPSIPSATVQIWKENQWIDDELHRSAEHFGWCLGLLSTEEAKALASCTDLEVTKTGLRTDLESGYRKFERVNRQYPAHNKYQLNSAIREAANWFEGGSSKSRTYAKIIPDIVKEFKKELTNLRERRLPHAQTMELLLAHIVHAPDDQEFIRLSHCIELLRSVSSLTRHILSNSPAFGDIPPSPDDEPLRDDPCTFDSSCSRLTQLSDILDKVVASTYFPAALKAYKETYTEIHNEWCDQSLAVNNNAPNDLWERIRAVTVAMMSLAKIDQLLPGYETT